MLPCAYAQLQLHNICAQFRRQFRSHLARKSNQANEKTWKLIWAKVFGLQKKVKISIGMTQILAVLKFLLCQRFQYFTRSTIRSSENSQGAGPEFEPKGQNPIFKIIVWYQVCSSYPYLILIPILTESNHVTMTLLFSFLVLGQQFLFIMAQRLFCKC